jgi:WD40 repeat protein
MCCCCLSGCFTSEQKLATPSDVVIADHPIGMPEPKVHSTLAEFPAGTGFLHLAMCGDSIIVADWDGQLIRLTMDGQPVWHIQEEWPEQGGQRLYPSALSVSPDNTLFAQCFQGRNGEVVIRSTLDGHLIARSNLRRSVAGGVAFDPLSSRTIWIVTVDGEVERWDIGEGTVDRINRAGSVSADFGASIFALTEAREMLVVGNAHAIVWNCETGAVVREYKGDWLSRSTTLSSDGRRAVSLRRASSAGWMNLAISARMTVWDVTTGTVDCTVDGWRRSKDNAESVDGAWLIGEHSLAAIGSSDGLRIIDLRSGNVQTASPTSSDVVAPLPSGSLATTIRDSETNKRKIVVLRVP